MSNPCHIELVLGEREEPIPRGEESTKVKRAVRGKKGQARLQAGGGH